MCTSAITRGEAARIERLSRVREFVLGAQDGLLVPLGVVTGMAAANPGAVRSCRRIAEAVAGCIAMGGGSYLASEAEEGLYAAEIADEGREIEKEPDREIAELVLVLEDEGLPRDAAERVAHGLAANPTVFLRTKVQKELGLSLTWEELRAGTRLWPASPTWARPLSRCGRTSCCRSWLRR